MSTQNPFRWGGLALILTAALFALGGILAAALPGKDLTSSIMPVFYYLGMIAAALALFALYGVQRQNPSALGRAGALLASAGAILYSGPQLALVAGSAGAAGWYDVWDFATAHVLLIGPPAFFIGMVLLGAAIWRGSTLPRWSGLLLAVGAFLWLIAYVLSCVPGLLTVASLVTGAGMAWMGWALWFWRVDTAV